jgi:dDENN domain
VCVCVLCVCVGGGDCRVLLNFVTTCWMVCCGVYVFSTAYVPCPNLPPINLTHRTYVTCRTEHSSDWQPFLKELTNTQMFSLFVDERALQSVGGDKLQGIMCGVSMGNRGGEGRGGDSISIVCDYDVWRWKADS